MEDVHLVKFTYRVSTRMPSEVTVDESGRCCRVSCLSSAIISICLEFYFALHFPFLKGFLCSPLGISDCLTVFLSLC